MDVFREFNGWESAIEDAENCKPEALAQLIRNGENIPANYRDRVAEVLMNPPKKKAGRPKSYENLRYLFEEVYLIKKFPPNGKSPQDKKIKIEFYEREGSKITEEFVKEIIIALKKTDRFKQMDAIYKKYPKFLNEKIDEMKVERPENLYDMIYKEFLEQHFVDTISVRF